MWQAKVGPKEELDALLPEYEGNPKPGFRKGVQDLGQVRLVSGHIISLHMYTTCIQYLAYTLQHVCTSYNNL